MCCSLQIIKFLLINKHVLHSPSRTHFLSGPIRGVRQCAAALKLVLKVKGNSTFAFNSSRTFSSIVLVYSFGFCSQVRKKSEKKTFFSSLHLVHLLLSFVARAVWLVSELTCWFGRSARVVDARFGRSKSICVIFVCKQTDNRLQRLLHRSDYCHAFRDLPMIA